MMKYKKYILIIIILIGLFGPMLEINAETSNYHLLAPLPAVGDSQGNVDTMSGLGAYLNPMIKLFIGLCAVLSVVMIVVGGLEYMTSELPGNKEAGKKRIMGAILGLLIALGAYALLFTINPDLLRSDIEPLLSTPTTSTPPTVAPFQVPNSGSNTNKITSPFP
ncbi:MAG: pilin [Patescibacteria group bacterium]